METMTGKPLPETYVQAQLRYIKKFISAHILSWFLHCIGHLEYADEQ